MVEANKRTISIRKMGNIQGTNVWSAEYIPMRCKTRSRKKPGWLSSKIRNAITEKQNAFIRFKITGLELDLYHYRSKQRQVKKITQQAK